MSFSSLFKTLFIFSFRAAPLFYRIKSYSCSFWYYSYYNLNSLSWSFTFVLGETIILSVFPSDSSRIRTNWSIVSIPIWNLIKLYTVLFSLYFIFFFNNVIHLLLNIISNDLVNWLIIIWFVINIKLIYFWKRLFFYFRLRYFLKIWLFLNFWNVFGLSFNFLFFSILFNYWRMTNYAIVIVGIYSLFLTSEITCRSSLTNLNNCLRLGRFLWLINFVITFLFLLINICKSMRWLSCTCLIFFFYYCTLFFITLSSWTWYHLLFTPKIIWIFWIFFTS